ncbi:hypothetical protein MKX03_034011 [Papaver bracteatum]|nr:hypothetical protein MKX03_034011 [Papaver bracteatum]
MNSGTSCNCVSQTKTHSLIDHLITKSNQIASSEHQRKGQESDPMCIEVEPEVGSPFRAEEGGDPEDRAVCEEYGKFFSKFFQEIQFTKHQQEMVCMHMLNIFSGEDLHKYIEKYFPRQITFSEKDRMAEIGHLHPLYIMTVVGKNILNRVLVYTGASLNLISQNTIRQLRIHPLEIIRFDTKVRDFSGRKQKTIGTIHLEITIRPIIFHVTETDLTCHIILGQPWLRKHRIVSSTDYQCIKFLHKGKEWRVAATKNSFTSAEKDLFPEQPFMNKTMRWFPKTISEMV